MTTILVCLVSATGTQTVGVIYHRAFAIEFAKMVSKSYKDQTIVAYDITDGPETKIGEFMNGKQTLVQVRV